MTIRNYEKYTLKDFLEDDSFIQWVKGDTTGNSLWESFPLDYPEKEKTFREAASIIRVYLNQPVFTNEEHREVVWSRIDASIRSRTPSKKIIPLKLYARIAASLALLIACSFAIWMLTTRDTRTITTAYGEKKVITLPDESIVMLNGNSALTYSDTRDSHVPREVWIKGEAYFDVKHFNNDTTVVLPGDRFIVHGNGIDIEVLGTSFNVKSRSDKTNIALLSGKIEVRDVVPDASSSGGLVMMPGDYVEYLGQKLLTRKKLTNPYKVASWTVGEIIFTDPSLNDIIETLQGSYGYHVHLEDQQLTGLKIEGEISVTSVQELLSLISSTLDIRIEESGKEINISRK